MVLAANLTGWWIGYAIGAAVVVIVALLVLILIATARRIAATAKDATGALREAQQRSEALWEIKTTNAVAKDILNGARQAREALGGGEAAEESAPATAAITPATGSGLGGVTPDQPATLTDDGAREGDIG